MLYRRPIEYRNITVNLLRVLINEFDHIYLQQLLRGKMMRKKTFHIF